MSPFRPDLVDCWMFRVGMTARGVERPEILLITPRARAHPARPVAVRLGLARGGRAGRRTARCASWPRRPGFGPDDIEAFYDLDLVNQFHEPSVDGDRDRGGVRGPRSGRTPSRRLSDEHDDARWHDLDEAHQQVIWPGYRTAIERIRDDLSEPERAAWFELTLDGQRTGPISGRPKLTRW